MATHWAMVDLGVSTGSVVAGQITPAVGYGGVLVAAGSPHSSGSAAFWATRAFARCLRAVTAGPDNIRNS